MKPSLRAPTLVSPEVYELEGVATTARFAPVVAAEHTPLVLDVAWLVHAKLLEPDCSGKFKAINAV